MELKFIDLKSSLYHEVLFLRYKLFFEEYNVPWEVMLDHQEDSSFHVALVDKENIIAYGRLSSDNNMTYQISQMVVAPSHQMKGYGAIIMRKLIEIVQSENGSSIYLNARIPALPFYEKFGFVRNGNSFLSKSTHLEHIPMILHLKEDL